MYGIVYLLAVTQSIPLLGTPVHFWCNFFVQKNPKCLIIITLGAEIQRKKGDSNPRYPVKGIPVFETSAFSHSAILPLGLQRYAKKRNIKSAGPDAYL